MITAISERGKASKEIWSTLADSDSATFSVLCARKTKELPISLTLFLFCFFHCSPMKIRPGQAEKSEKASFVYLFSI